MCVPWRQSGLALTHRSYERYETARVSVISPDSGNEIKEEDSSYIMKACSTRCSRYVDVNMVPTKG